MWKGCIRTPGNASLKMFVYTCADIDSMTECFTSKLVSLLEAHAPVQRLRPKSALTATERWYTPAMDKASTDAEMVKRQYKLDNRKLWHRLRNKYNELIKYAKINYYKLKLNPKLGSKRLWNNAKALGLVSSKKTVVRPNFTADEFNSHVTGSSCQAEVLARKIVDQLRPDPAVCLNIYKSPLLNNRHLLLSAGIAGILSIFTKDEETAEDKLINNIKRSILCIQRGEHRKAEQMLHLALRMAQDLRNEDGITFVYDVMANLSMDTGELKKAEKLFVTVMQRLLKDGYAQDDIKMLHISGKLAEIKFQSGELAQAEQGFKWTIEKLDQKLAETKEDSELLELWGISKDNYAQLLMTLGKYDEAKVCLSQAYDVYSQLNGRNNPEVATLLNNLGVVCTNTNDLAQAEVYLTEAIELSKQFPEIHDSGIFQANRGLLFIKQGLLDEARKVCTFAWKFAKKSESKDGIEQADYCLKQLKNLGFDT
ncbi:Tetratricopeptide repeat protein 19 like, mitochondrial [Pseudolycoriella hygida]|uniref:Tetratricopeptide repeat protein 19 like, mitochondrial n=1 Tax=Pseudolycoriella hygida TaxID=35572 RepID=A0A9Q0S6F2_9DIPT|nr:Tetratricopeptide repeat protein 19 like, mitochondrial [Pseudolycoriella hygida]